MRFGLGQALTISLILLGEIASCGKDTGTAAPQPVTVEPTPASIDETEPTETGVDEQSQPRVELEAEFHRTRFGLGTGIWVLGMVHNPHAERVTEVRLQVRLLDEVETVVGRADGRLGRSLGPGDRAAVAVHVSQPVAHEQLVLIASAVVADEPAPEPLPLRLEHEDPQRADFGGWYVVGKVENTGETAVEGARIEIQGLDESGELLGIDWLVLDPIDAGETIEFDVGDLRYEEAPAQFLLELREG